jgi:hypothetical protein
MFPEGLLSIDGTAPIRRRFAFAKVFSNSSRPQTRESSSAAYAERESKVAGANACRVAGEADQTAIR